MPMTTTAAATALLAAAACVAANDVSFSEDGYTMSLIGASGKIRYEVEDGDKFLQIQNDELHEVRLDGSNLSPDYAVPSWASQSLTWSNSSCPAAPDTVALRICADTEVNVGSNGNGAPTADFYVQADLTNATFYFACGCGGPDDLSRASVDGPEETVTQPFATNYNSTEDGFCSVCASSCVTCNATDATCTVNATTTTCEAGAGQVSSFLPSVATQGQTVSDYDAAASCTAAPCVCVGAELTACDADGACPDGSTAGTVTQPSDPESLASTDDYTTADCSSERQSSLKFSIAVNGWPWSTTDPTTELSYGVEIKGSGSKSGDDDDDDDDDDDTNDDVTFSTSDNLELRSSPDYVRCRTGDCPDEMPDTYCVFGDDGNIDSTECCIVRDGVRDGGIVSTKGSKEIVTYRFINSTQASAVCYDPAIGEKTDDNSGVGGDSSPAAALSTSLLAVFAAVAAAFGRQ